MQTPGTDRRPLALLLIANIVSIAGSMLTYVAIPWFVLETTGSAGRAGLTAFAATLPVVLAALLGGPLIDRLGLAVSSVLSDTVCAVAVAAVPLLHLAGHLSYGALLALVAVSGLFHAPGETAREVLMPKLAERAGTTVARASSAYEGASRGARMLGAPLAGVLIAAAGAANVLLLDAASFAVSAALIGLGVREGTHRGGWRERSGWGRRFGGKERAGREALADGVRAGGERAGGERRPGGDRERTTFAGYRAQLREGYAFLFRARLLFAVVGMVMVTNALDQAWSAVLLPVDARQNLGGSVSIGVVSGTFAAAALTGSLLYGVFGQRLPQRALYIGAFIVCGFPRTAVGAFVPGLTPLVVTNAVCGLAGGVLNPIIGTEMVRLCPEHLRSRVFGAVTSGVLVAVPLGALAGGYVVQYAGLTVGMATVSVLYLLTTLSPLVLPAFRAWESAPVPEPAAALREPATG